jgi:Holliday junction resolvase RusA-like endonuclease
VPEGGVVPPEEIVTIAFTVLGVARPQGSMKPFLPKGARFPIVTHDNKASLMPWRQDVAGAAEKARLERGIFSGVWPTSEAVELRATFFLPRPLGHFGKKGLRPSAPRFPSKKPDLSKLVRAAEDALSGIVYDDDARIVSERVRKLYADGGKPPRAEFEIELLEVGNANAAEAAA